MRIRLDKLFLSAGLALAMVATTIPVGAATSTTPASSSEVTGWVINGETVTDITTTDGAKAFGNAITGYSVDGEITNSALSVAGKVTKIEATDTEVVEVTTAGDITPLNEELLSTVDGLTKVAKYTLTAPKVKVTSTYTVPVTAKYTKTVVATDAEDTAVTSATSDNKDKAVNAVNTAASTLESAASTAATNSEKGIAAVVTATDITTSAFSDDDVAAAKGDTATEVSVTRNVTFTEVLIYTVSELPSTVTYDCVSETLVATSSDAFSAYYEKLNGQAWGTGSVEVVNDTSVMLHVSDLSKVYYIYKGVQSATGNLLFAPTEGKDAATNVVVTSGDYTATITKNDDANDADYTLAKDAPESATVAGYFSIALTKGGAPATNGPSITFKIAVPTDVTASEGKQIKWQVVRVHDYGDGNGPIVELLSATEENGYIVFSSEYFSDFALIYTEVAADTTEEETNNETNNETESATEAGTETTTTTANSSTTSTTTSTKTADNSMMPLFMTTLLLALCAGSLAIYKEKKTN